MTAPEPAPGVSGDRMAAVRRLESTALGSRALQRLTGLAVRLLGADAAAVSLLGDVETVVSGDGLPAGSLGRRVPVADSLQDDVALVAIRLHPEDRSRPAEAGPERVPDLVDPQELVDPQRG